MNFDKHRELEVVDDSLYTINEVEANVILPWLRSDVLVEVAYLFMKSNRSALRMIVVRENIPLAWITVDVSIFRGIVPRSRIDTIARPPVGAYT